MRPRLRPLLLSRVQVATTCLFLASKVEETPKKLKDVIIECYKVQNSTVQPPGKLAPSARLHAPRGTPAPALLQPSGARAGRVARPPYLLPLLLSSAAPSTEACSA